MRTNCRKTIKVLKRANKKFEASKNDLIISVSKDLYEAYKKGYEAAHSAKA